MNADRKLLRFVVYFECSLSKNMKNEDGGIQDLSMSGIQFKMRQRLIRKFKKAGATSEEKAVTFIEAKLDLPEQYWLDYFAGNFLGCIKKTRDHRYYIQNTLPCDFCRLRQTTVNPLQG